MKDEIKEILDNPKILMLSYGNYISLDDYVKLKDCMTNLQEKVNQYEDPDDMTLMFMWCDEKAKDKIKQLQEENERLSVELNKNMIERNNYLSKNEKAIEILKNGIVNKTIKGKAYINLADLLNILQGEDKDE